MTVQKKPPKQHTLTECYLGLFLELNIYPHLFENILIVLIFLGVSSNDVGIGPMDI